MISLVILAILFGCLNAFLAACSHNKDYEESTLLLVLASICCSLVFFICAVEIGTEFEKRNAIRAGAAKYVSDTLTGRPQFSYTPYVEEIKK